MNEERDRKTHRLAWSSAIAVLVVAFGAPLAGAAGIEAPRVTEVPLPANELPLPDVPESPLPEVEPPLPVPDVTTLPVPVEELTGDVGSVVDGVGEVVDDVTGGAGDVVDDVTGGAGDVVDDVTGGAGDVVDDVVDEVTDPEGPVGGVVDEVTDPDGPVGGVIDDVTDPDGPVGGVVDEVTDPEGPVGGVVDEVTDPKGPVGGVVDGVAKNVDSVVDNVGEVVDGFVGGLPAAPGTPGIDVPGTGGVDAPIGGPGSDGVADTAEEAAILAEHIAATVSPDGFAAGVLAAAQTVASAPSPRDLPEPSLIEQIARSASEVAQKIAFPLLLALAVGAFVVVQNRVDRKDPKLALAAVDADEDLLGFE